jgi:hypothetical protein
MKKEYLLLLVAIVGLAALLVYQKKGRTNYQLPQLTVINDSVDRLVLKEDGRKVELRQVDGSWVVGPKSYRADNDRAAKMVDAIRNLKLVALVSEKENYHLYELNEKKRFTVGLFHDQTLLREVMIGKNSPSLRQTYVMLKDDPKVYQALGNLKSNFFSTIAELRDKEVLKITHKEREQIDKITLEHLHNGKKELLRMVKIMPKSETEAKTPASDAKERADKPVSTAVSGWQSVDGTPVATTAITTLLDTLANLKCKNYLDDLSPDKFKEPAYRVVVKAGKAEFSIAFLEASGNEYRALSSQTSQPFLVPGWQAKKIVKEFSDYTGVKQKSSGAKK